MVSEIKAGYSISPYLEDVCLYLVQNKLSSLKAPVRRTEVLVERYSLLNSLLFRLHSTPGKTALIFAVPENCVDRMIALYHSSIS